MRGPHTARQLPEISVILAVFAHHRCKCSGSLSLLVAILACVLAHDCFALSSPLPAAVEAICRFEELQLEWIALEGAAPLARVLATGQQEAQLQACRAAAAVARHRDGREALAQEGAVKALLRIARDVLHPAQEHAAAALANTVGLEAVATPRVPTTGSASGRAVRRGEPRAPPRADDPSSSSAAASSSSAKVAAAAIEAAARRSAPAR